MTGSAIELLRRLPRPLKRAFWKASAILVPNALRLPFEAMQLGARGGLEEEMDFLPAMVGPGTTVVDIGANMGLYSYRCAKLGARVQAFEPNPACLRILRAYRSDRIESHQVAISSAHGSATLHVPIVDGSTMAAFASLEPAEGRFEAVAARTAPLDSFSFPDIALLKIDVEGHEMQVLAGAIETIRLHRPVVMIEVEERHSATPISATFEYFAAHDYRGFFVFERRLRALEEFDAGTHQRDFLAGKQTVKYVNNFFMVPREKVAAFRAGIERILAGA